MAGADRRFCGRVTAMHTALTYIIIEDGAPLDGEFYSHAAVLRAVQYADADARVMAIDLAEFMRDRSTPARDVTEEIVNAAWAGDWIDNIERADAGLVGKHVELPAVGDRRVV